MTRFGVYPFDLLPKAGALHDWLKRAGLRSQENFPWECRSCQCITVVEGDPDEYRLHRYVDPASLCATGAVDCGCHRLPIRVPVPGGDQIHSTMWETGMAPMAVPAWTCAAPGGIAPACDLCGQHPAVVFHLSGWASTDPRRTTSWVCLDCVPASQAAIAVAKTHLSTQGSASVILNPQGPNPVRGEPADLAEAREEIDIALSLMS